MTTPDNDDFVQDEPLPMNRPRPRQTRRSRLRGATRKVSPPAGDRWKQRKIKAGVAGGRTEFFLRENPVPTILGALIVGLAVGFAIRYAYNEERRQADAKTALGWINSSLASLPSVRPFLKSVKEKYEDSTDAVRDRVGRLKKIDIGDYIEPIRKRWKW